MFEPFGAASPPPQQHWLTALSGRRTGGGFAPDRRFLPGLSAGEPYVRSEAEEAAAAAEAESMGGAKKPVLGAGPLPVEELG